MNIADLTRLGSALDDLRSLPDSQLEWMNVGADALRAAMEASGAPSWSSPISQEYQRRRLAQIGITGAIDLCGSPTLAAIPNLPQLNYVLGSLLEDMKDDVAVMTTMQLEHVISANGGGTLAAAFRWMASAELDWREQTGC